jgi:hypothetical protein
VLFNTHCAERDKDVFEKMGYRLEESKALAADGKEIAAAVVMLDEEASTANYDELTALTGIPFLVCNSSVLALSATTSLFRTARSGTTPRLCMRATIPL